MYHTYTTSRGPEAKMSGPSVSFGKLQQPPAPEFSAPSERVDEILREFFNYDEQNHEQRHKQPKPSNPAFKDLKIAYLACQKSAGGVKRHASSQRKAEAWCDMIQIILQTIKVREEEDTSWCGCNREYNHMQ
jgi:hypothetical protein